MNRLNTLLNDLESKIASGNITAPEVSQSNVAWHIAHSLKVIIKVTEAVKQSNPQEYQWKFNWVRSLVYSLGFIPRGKGKAPKSVLPDEDTSTEKLNEALNTAREMIAALAQLEEKNNFQHPYFGQLNAKETKRFLVLHTYHHIKIINDILRKSILQS